MQNWSVQRATAGKEYELNKEVISIGRAPTCDVVLEDQYASRQHAELRRVETAYQVHDLHSKNGVMVDGIRLALGGTAWLQDGSEVQFASTRFRVQDPSATLTAPALIAVREPGLRVEQATRQVFVDGMVLDPPLSVKQFDLSGIFIKTGRVEQDEIAQAASAKLRGRYL
jgi:hypothetical protein